MDWVAAPIKTDRLQQFYGPSRYSPPNAKNRRPCRTLCFSGQVLFEWLAHQTSVRLLMAWGKLEILTAGSGVKKPLNPILGETFTCYWDYPDNTRGYYISEQTSHHPPKSSYFFMAPEHHIRVDGTLKPRSRFLGNSAASLMEGISYLRFTNRGKSKGGEK